MGVEVRVWRVRVWRVRVCGCEGVKGVGVEVRVWRLRCGVRVWR